jgi:hypothetical protein
LSSTLRAREGLLEVLERELGETELYREEVRLLFQELVTWLLAVDIRILGAARGRDHSGSRGRLRLTGFDEASLPVSVKETLERLKLASAGETETAVADARPACVSASL